MLISQAGGTGIFVEVAAVVNAQGQPRHAASAYLGDRIKIPSWAIQDGRIVVRMITQGPNEGMLNPTHEVIRTFRLEGDTLTRKVGDDTGSWVQYDPYTDPLTDEQIVGIGLQSYDYAEAHLLVFCRHNQPEGRASELDVVINWGAYLGSGELEVLTRFDKRDLQRDQWEVSTTDNRATFAPPWEVSALLWYMVNASSLVEPVSNLAARVVKHDGTWITAQWRIDGFPAASRPLAEHCYLPVY